MPTPRNCRHCGAVLSADVRWCGQCSERVTEFAARPSTNEGFVGVPSHRVRTSRWRASATTFGPTGRLTVTALMLVMLATGLSATGVISPFGLWFFMGWMILAGFVLRQTWAPVKVDGPETGFRARVARRFPRAGARIDPRAALIVATVPLFGAMAYVWIEGDTLARFGLILVIAMIGLVALLISLTDP
jgi:hypothetical protein